MSTFVQKPNTGASFPNDRKEKPTHPDFAGAANVVCEKCQHRNELWVNEWVKTREDGTEYFSKSFRHKAAANQNPEPEKPKSNVRSIKRAAPAPK